jgi:hypothetical protein
MDALPDDRLAPEDPRRRVLLEAVQQLDSIDRQVVLLYLEGLSAREIEQVTGLSANSISVRLSRLRRRLASIVMRHFAELCAPYGDGCLEREAIAMAAVRLPAYGRYPGMPLFFGAGLVGYPIGLHLRREEVQQLLDEMDRE